MIRLATVIGHGMELLPHFIKHYSQYVDEIHLVIYRTERDTTLSEFIKDTASQYNGRIKIYKEVRYRAFDWQKVTDLYNEITSQYPNDWWVIADIDEFHLYPDDNIYELLHQCNENGWDIVRGGFIDRIGKNGEFSKLGNKSVWETFPNLGFFRYPMSGACPNKIPIKKGYIKLTSGQHYVEFEGHTTWRWQGWNHPLIAPYQTYSVQVHHFKWDSTCVDRIKQVADTKKEYSFSYEYKKMYDSIEKNNFLIDISRNDYMFETSQIDEFSSYKKWKNLINKIVSI